MTSPPEDRVFTRFQYVVPTRVEVAGDFFTWAETLPDNPQREYVLGDLLADFVQLEKATAPETAAFLETYGIPELCHHGVPDRHAWARGTHALVPGDPEQFCPFATVDGQSAIGALALRRMARAFSAASRLGVALAARTEGELSDWVELQGAQRWTWVPGDLDGDWRRRRSILAAWMTDLLRSSGVSTLARWPEGGRLSVVPEAEGLMGSIAIALAFEVGQRDGYLCGVCGTPVDRIRPPKVGEGVYCAKPACKREQQRVNQKRYRERKRQERAGK